MLDSTMELISLAASNSLAVFCVCNLIIAFLLVGTSKPQFDEGKKTTKKMPNAEHFKKSTDSSPQEANVLIEEDKVHVIDNEEEEENPIQEDNDNNDDELRKRVEEFIEKINRGWEAEKLKK